MSIIEQNFPNATETPDGLFVHRALTKDQRTHFADLVILRHGVNWQRCDIYATPNPLRTDLVIIGAENPLQLFYDFFWYRFELQAQLPRERMPGGALYYDRYWRDSFRPRAEYRLIHKLTNDGLPYPLWMHDYRDYFQSIGYEELSFESVIPQSTITAAEFFGAV